jgi:hypothetical protein
MTVRQRIDQLISESIDEIEGHPLAPREERDHAVPVDLTTEIQDLTVQVQELTAQVGALAHIIRAITQGHQEQEIGTRG